MSNFVRQKMEMWMLTTSLLLSTILTVSTSVLALTPFDSGEEFADDFIFNSYQSACYKLQDMADWMNVVFKVKSRLAKSMAEKESRNAHDTVKRVKREISDPCESLKNLPITAESYVKFQAQLVEIKALLGGILLRNGVGKLEETSNAVKTLQQQIKDLVVLNRTSTDIFHKLKMSTEGLLNQLQRERSGTLNLLKEFGRRNDFFYRLHNRKDQIVKQLNSVLNTNKGLQRTQTLLTVGNLLQNLGTSLINQIPPPEEEKQEFLDLSTKFTTTVSSENVEDCSRDNQQINCNT